MWLNLLLVLAGVVLVIYNWGDSLKSLACAFNTYARVTQRLISRHDPSTVQPRSG